MKRAIVIILLLDIVIFILACIITWLTDIGFGIALIMAGVGAIGIGVAAAMGGPEIAESEYDLRYNQTIPQLKYERTSDKFREIHKSYRFFLYMAVASILPISVGCLIEYLQ